MSSQLADNPKQTTFCVMLPLICAQIKLVQDVVTDFTCTSFKEN